MANKTDKIRLGVGIALAIGLFAFVGAFIGLGIAGFLSAWIVALVVVSALGVALWSLGTFLSRHRESTIIIEKDNQETANQRPDVIEEEGDNTENKKVVRSPKSKTIIEKDNRRPAVIEKEKRDNTRNKGVFSTPTKKPSPSIDLTKKPPFLTSYQVKSPSRLNPPGPPVSSPSEKKAEWVLQDCKDILYGERQCRLEFIAEPEQNAHCVTIKIFPPPNLSKLCLQAKELYQKSKTITEAVANKILQEYNPNNLSPGYVGGNLIVEKKTGNFDSLVIYVLPKAIDQKISQEWQKEQFKDRIVSIFNETTLPRSDELNFIKEPRILHCIKDNPNQTCYEFYSIITQESDEASCSSYLNWLKDTINTNLKNDLVTLRMDQVPGSSEITLKLEARCYKVAQLLEAEAEAEATTPQLNSF